MKLSVFDLDNWREIGATLARNKTRTFLTAFGIFWGTAMLALLWGASRGFQGIMYRNFYGVSTNMGVMFPDIRNLSYKGYNKGSSWSMNFGDIEALRAGVKGLEYITGILSNSADASYGSRTASGTVIGAGSDYFAISKPVLVDGRLINEADVNKGEKICLIGANRASDLFGSGKAVGEFININNVYYRVVGVVRQVGDAHVISNVDDSFYIPATTFRQIYNTGDRIYGLIFTTTAGISPTDVKGDMMRIVFSRHYIHPADTQAANMMDISEVFNMISNVFLGIQLLALFVGFGTLMAGVIGVGNIMWIIVRERTHEFGIRRSIGAKPSDITAQVLSEAVVLTLVAGTAGVCFASIILGIADHVSADPVTGVAGFELPFGWAVGIVVVFFILGSAAGTLPAIKAMRIKPIEAMNEK